MWTDKQFWRDSTWRAFRTFCQSLAGLLTVQQVSSDMNAPWLTLIYASGVAGLISLLQSIDRERAVTGTTVEPVIETQHNEPTVEAESVVEVISPEPIATFVGCGNDLR